MGASVGLSLTSSGNIIQGLIINNFGMHGVSLFGAAATGNIISGNYIGTDSTGNVDQGNGFSGIFIGFGASNNLIGGTTPADRNVISGNNQSGILIDGAGTDTNTVSGNHIGVNADGSVSLPNSWDGVRISGGPWNNRIGGNTAGERNIISGNSQTGIRLEGADTDSNLIIGNYIGLTRSGTGGLGNQDTGILLMSGANHNVIGGGTPQQRNVISGNGDQGIYLNGAHYNYISGNFIGTDPSGTAPRGSFNGILLAAATNNVIGGDTPGTGNVISGNLGGIVVGTGSNNNTIQGNIIGLAADGLTPRPNNFGMTIAGSLNTIGGTLPAQRNIISGNAQRGIQIAGGATDAANNTISGNYIGTDASGRTAAGNNIGVFLGPRAASNLIGGEAPGSANVISGNQFGVWLEGGPDICRFYTIRGNHIGTDVTGRNPLGNLHEGVYFGQVSQSNTVGPGNVIAFNGGNGVQVDTPTATRNFITSNSIFANNDKGIRLSNGANGTISPPVIQGTTFGLPTSIRIAVAACPNCAVQVFNSRFPDGEGERYLSGGLADGAGNYILEILSLQYPYLTATASYGTMGTSEFSPVFVSTAYLTYLPLVLR